MGVFAALGTGNPELGIVAGGIAAAAFFTLDRESLRFVIAREQCDFFSKKAYDICRPPR